MASSGDRDGASRTLASVFFALVGITYGLLIFGASVRVHGAGLACPDWPLCFGELIPTFDFRIFLEWGHRVLASLISLGFLGASVVALSRSDTRRAVGPLIGVALLTLGTQIVLGGLTVLKLLAFWSVTLHLLAGNTFCALLLLIALRLRGFASHDDLPRAASPMALLLVVSVFIQLALGGLVSSNYAGLACTEWPTCNGGVWFPAFDGIIGLQLAHRLGAYTVLAISAAFWWVARGSAAYRPATVVFVTVLVQALLGIANVLLVMPVELAILHSAVADLIVLGAVWAAWRTRGQARQPAAAFVAEARA